MFENGDISELRRRIEDLEALVRENMEERHPVLETGGLGVNALPDEAVTSVALTGNPQLTGDVVLAVAGLIAGAQVDQTITFTGTPPSPYIPDVMIGGDARPNAGPGTLTLLGAGSVNVAWSNGGMTAVITGSPPSPYISDVTVAGGAARPAGGAATLGFSNTGNVVFAWAGAGTQIEATVAVDKGPNTQPLPITTTKADGVETVPAAGDQQTLAQMTIINGGDIIGLAALLTNGEFFLWDPGG